MRDGMSPFSGNAQFRFYIWMASFVSPGRTTDSCVTYLN